MKNISLNFEKINGILSIDLLNEKKSNLRDLSYYYHSNKNNVNESKKKEILKFLLKEYFNFLLIKNNNESQQYLNDLIIFLKDKIVINDIDFVIGKEFPDEMKNNPEKISQLIEKLNVKVVNDNEIVSYQYGELFINENNLNKLLKSKMNDNVIKELTQMWMFFELNRYQDLSKSFENKFNTEKSKDFFKNGLNYEIVIKDKLQNFMSLNHFWSSFNLLDINLKLTNESKLLLSNKYHQEINNKSDSLIYIHENCFYFNYGNIEKLLKEGFSKEKKKELLKAYLVAENINKFKNIEYKSDSLLLLLNYKERIKNKLLAQVSKNFLTSTFDEIKSYLNKCDLSVPINDLATFASDTIISRRNNQILINTELLNKKLNQENNSENQIEFMFCYILNKLNSHKNFEMKIWRKENESYLNLEILNIINSKNDTNKFIFNQEDRIYQSIKNLDNKKIIMEIYTFFKDIELDKFSQELLYNELMIDLLRQNTLNSDKNKNKNLILSKDFSLYNKENINFQNKEDLLKIYVFNKLFKDRKDLETIVDKSIEETSHNLTKVIEVLKNNISEKDIFNKILEIEKEIGFKNENKDYSSFNELSIELDAKNDLSFMTNELLVFKHEKKTALSTVFVKEDVLNKLLNKTIDSYNVKELAKVCLFAKIMDINNDILRNNNNHLMILNESCENIKNKIPKIIEKIKDKALDKEIDLAMKEISEHFNFNVDDSHIKLNVIFPVKKSIGIKVKSPFKHLL